MVEVSQHPVTRIRLCCVLKDISLLVARIISVPDDLELKDLHELFLVMLGWGVPWIFMLSR